MKFYIFASNKKEIKTSRRKAFFSSSEFEECYDKFYNICRENRFDNAYLVADFESERKNWVSTIDNNNEESVPFLIVCEYHFQDYKCNSGMNYSRKDNTCVTRKGFAHEFKDNLAAIREFLYCFDNHIRAEFELSYIVGTRTYTRKIASTVDILRSQNYTGCKLRRILLKPTIWENTKSEKRSFQMYKIEKAVN